MSVHRVAAKRRYRSLGWGELVSAAGFAAVAAVAVVPRLDARDDVLALWSALAPLLVILVQAGVYWLLARGWVGRAGMPKATAAVYRLFRVLDVVVLVGGLVGVSLFLPSHVGLALLVIGIWLFGVIEYLNYFVVRLAYPAGEWLREVTRWRTPRLVRDLRSAK